MLVEAKCVADCWDSTACRYYEAGKVYSIDTESQIAKLTVARTLHGQGRPAFCFQFDRSQPGSK